MPDLREQLQSTLGDGLILEQELGGGGMSRVFLAHEPALGRKVVVKVLPPEMAAGVRTDRFRREIQFAAQLQHPHIVPLLSAGETDGLPYYTMPYVRGESLRARLVKGELPLAETIRILREVASALAYAHESGVVHRDIKPENILISGGSAVVTDFGVAKALSASTGEDGSGLTSLGVAIGTPAYMAPEQATADRNVDNRADIYALGIVAYEMLSGSTPFAGRSPQATLAAHVTESPQPIERRRATVPPLLASLVMRCLEKRAADRPQSATDVVHELDSLTTPSGGLAPTAQIIAPKKRSNKRWLIGSIAAIAIVVTLAVIASIREERALAKVVKESPAIAVLPFENVGTPEGKDFADGMTEEITNRLSSLRGLRVIGRQSAKSYANTSKTPREIANELNVQYLLTGTVRWDKSEGNVLVRVSPALLKADDATQLWGEAYQTVVSGMFDVQSKVATEVANALNVNLLTPERAALQAKPTSNPEAYTLFLRGKLITEESLQPEGLREAVKLLQKATTADPKFVAAWAYLGIAYTEMYWYSKDHRAEVLQRALDALNKAAALDSDSPDLHLARGIYLYHGRRDYEGALSEFAEVTAQRPNDPTVPVFIGAIKRRQGKWSEAIESFQHAVELEPRNGSNMIDLGATQIAVGNYEEAEAITDRGMILSREMDGPMNKVRIAIFARGNVPEAIEHLRNATQTVTPPLAVMNLMAVTIWPAVEDPMLRNMILSAVPTPDFPAGMVHSTKAQAYWYLNDFTRAKAYGDTALPELQAAAAKSTSPADLYQQIAIIQAIKGKRAEALRALADAERALPLETDRFSGAERANLRVSLLALLNDKEAALTELGNRLDVPAGLTRNQARLDPVFTGLRADPRFQRMVQGQ